MVDVYNLTNTVVGDQVPQSERDLAIAIALLRGVMPFNIASSIYGELAAWQAIWIEMQIIRGLP
jgi:hypothetical protein